MVVEQPDDRWREVAQRLIADTHLLDRGFEPDLFGQRGPSLPMGAQVLEAGRVVTTRLAKLTERLDQLHGHGLTRPPGAGCTSLGSTCTTPSRP